MLSNISWSSYWTVLLLATAIYYLYAARFIYGPAIGRLFSGNSAHGIAMSPNVSEGNAIQSYRDEIIAYLDQISIERPPKRELLVALQRIGQHHPVILQHPYRQAAQQILISELKNYCAVTLNGDELEQVTLAK
jgi:hypothetical protein